MHDHVFRLMSRHQRLDEELRREMTRRTPDFARLRRLRQLKLKMRDLLNTLAARPVGDNAA